MEDSLTIEQPDYEQMLAHLQVAYPLEGCGLLAGRGKRVLRVYPIENILSSPVAYEMDPRRQIETMLAVEAAGMEVVAIYHSHPLGPAAPSATDMEQAYYPEIRHIIVSLSDRRVPVARAYWIDAERVRSIALRIL